MDERREFDRVPLTARIIIQAGDDSFSATCYDSSLAGVNILIEATAVDVLTEQDDPLLIRFEKADQEFYATVSWYKASDGGKCRCGLRFLDVLSQEEIAALRQHY